MAACAFLIFAKPVSQDRLAHVMPVHISAVWFEKNMPEKKMIEKQQESESKVDHHQQGINRTFFYTSVFSH